MIASGRLQLQNDKLHKLPTIVNYTIVKLFCWSDFTQMWKKSVGDRIISLRGRRRVWQNPYIEEEQTTQWPKEKVQKDKQRSTKHTHKLKIEYYEPQ